jgi:uncharacterized phage-associated protein
MYNDEVKPGKIVFWIALFFVFCFGVDWIVMGNQFFMYQFFAPKQEAVRRQVYEQTKSYRQGSVQRLNTLCSQVSSADSDHKPMLNDIISHEFSEWDTNDVPGYLQPCLASARSK